MTTISVVIPTYNRRDLVLRALDSVTRQTRSPEEIIVIDDGSEDGTSAAIARQYPNVNLISQANRGVSAARNAGIKLASSTWIALLDSDDSWHEEKLEKQIELAAITPEAQLIHCDEHWVRNGQALNQKAYHRKSGGDIFEVSLQRCMISPSAALITRNLLLDTGLFDENLPACEDYDLWLRICSQHEVAFVDEKLVTKFGGHPDQLSKRIWGLDRFRIRALAKLLLSGSLNETQAALANSVMQNKTRIFTQGAAKRGNSREAQVLSQLSSKVARLCQ